MQHIKIFSSTSGSQMWDAKRVLTPPDPPVTRKGHLGQFKLASVSDAQVYSGLYARHDFLILTLEGNVVTSKRGPEVNLSKLYHVICQNNRTDLGYMILWYKLRQYLPMTPR